MEDILYTIEPNSSGDRLTIIVALLAALGALAGMFALLRTPSTGDQRNRRMLGAMLLFFVVLIASGTSFFSWLKTRKVSTITIYNDAVETPYGKVAFRNIKNASIETDRQPSFVNPSRATRQTKLLLIEEMDGKAHVMSEKDYDLQNIMSKLKKAVKQWEDSQGSGQ